MDVATSSTPQRGVSYAPSCEGRERSVGIASSENGANARYRVNSSTWPDSTHPATQLSNGCAHTSVGMTVQLTRQLHYGAANSAVNVIVSAARPNCEPTGATLSSLASGGPPPITVKV
jgi:hypothetical protein